DSCFFFSSRRRHTRFSRDWSSDVCSSDLFRDNRDHLSPSTGDSVSSLAIPSYLDDLLEVDPLLEDSNVEGESLQFIQREEREIEIGRASCREREERAVDVVSLKG